MKNFGFLVHYKKNECILYAEDEYQKEAGKQIQKKHMFDIWGKSYEKLTWPAVYDNIIYSHMYILYKWKS